MRTLTEYHNKHVLISGQGPTEEIAKMIGFKSITTIEKVCAAFPELDMVNHTNRVKLVCTDLPLLFSFSQQLFLSFFPFRAK